MNTHERSRKNSFGPVFDFLFIRRVPAIIWIMLLLFSGFAGYQGMVRESLPDLEIPEAYVITTWEGATPAMVEKEVTAKIERQLRGMKGLKNMYSSSQHELSIIAVSFHADCSVSESLQLLERQVSTAASLLPKAAKRPRVEATSVRDLPIGSLVLYSEGTTQAASVSRSVLEEQARKLAREMNRVSGIRKARLVGGRKQVVRVRLQPEQMRAAGIPATLVRERIMNSGSDAPWGRFDNPDFGFSMKLDGAYRDLDTLRNLVLQRDESGSPLRLRDVAQVSKGHLPERTRAFLSWKGSAFEPVVAIELLKEPGQDTIALVNRVKQALDRATQSSEWPRGVQCRLTANQAEAIQVELDRGLGNGWQSMLAVFLVLFVLLTWREALVAAISVPLTLLGSMAVLWMAGYTFNMLVLVGMILALGLLVDDFILIMEGMHEGIFIQRLGFAESVRRTIRMYAMPSFSGSVTTVLVLLPLAFVGGVDGKFIRVIPVAAAVCLIVSYVVSVLLGPALVRMFIKPDRTYGPGVMDRFSHAAEDRLQRWLGIRVVGSRGQAWRWVAGAALTLCVSLFFAANLRETLYPKEDGRELGVTVTLAPEAPLEHTAKVARRVGDILAKKPWLEHVMMVVGGKDSFSMVSIHDLIGKNKASHVAGFACFLVPGSQRDRLAYQYVPELRAELKEALRDEPGAKVFMTPQVGGSSRGDAIQIDLTGEDMGELRHMSEQVMAALKHVPGVVDVRDNLGPARTELRFTPKPESMDFHKVNREGLAGQMVAWMENEKVGTYRLSGTRDDLDIRLGGRWENTRPSATGPEDWKELERLAVVNAEGHSVPLWSLVQPRVEAASQVILHKQGRRTVTVLAKLDGVYVSEVLDRMRPEMENMRQSWPAGYEYLFAGEADVEATYANMFRTFLLSVLLVYAMLALLFDSLLHPVIILSTVLFSLVGVFTGFFFLGIPFSFSASIGMVALVGIVVNDAIIMVETMNSRRKNGAGVREAAAQGVADRLRPIVSTTITNFAGLAPLALSDPGWAPLCQAIIFGEFTATIGAVLLVPALYVLLTRSKSPS